MNDSSVTITPGLYLTSIMAFWGMGNSPIAYSSMLEIFGSTLSCAGLENTTINSSQRLWVGIVFYEANDRWVKGVALRVVSNGVGNSTRTGVLIHLSRNITVQDNWLDQMGGGGFSSTKSYGFVNVASSANLWQDNILWNVESRVLWEGGSGDVHAYNYDLGVCNAVAG